MNIEYSVTLVTKSYNLQVSSDSKNQHLIITQRWLHCYNSILNKSI